MSKQTDCIEWDGYRNRKGYGKRKFRGKNWLAHRAAYTEAYGEIPEGMLVCHHCDNPPCVNPEHLFLGTPADNSSDMTAKGRQARGEASGKAKLTEDQVRAIRADTRMRREIAADYGVDSTVVSRIRLRHTWRHVS